MQYHFFTIFLLIFVTIPLISNLVVPPTWVTSSYVQAGTQSIIKTKTGNASTPTATLPFATAFSSLPNIGYGITDYDGGDTLGEQMLEVNRTGLTSSSFSVLVQIKGYTNIWLLNVRYIAIDSLFPHKLNSFDNVPINYLNGALTNITVFSPTLTSYTNTINFTYQSIASGQNSFTQFSTPFQNNKILLFLTSFFLDGNLDSVSAPNPINMKVYTTVLNQTSYQIRATFITNVKITRLHFSMIVFDEVNVTSSQLYQLVYQRVDLVGTGGFVPIPQQFISNLIMGLVQFQTSRTRTVINFRLYFQTNSTGVFGINFPYLTPRSASFSILAIRYGFTLFYMKTWVCPNNTFFNILTNLCESCSLLQCTQCQSLSKCITCNSTINYVLNQTLTCVPCTIPNCITCKNQTNCVTCDFGHYLNLVTNLCEINICGDAVYQIPEQCDDGNLQDGDGCSSFCVVQVNYSCQPNSLHGQRDSFCFYIGQITLNVILIQKTDGTNQVQILIDIGPKNSIIWQAVDFSQLVSLSNMNSFENYEVIMNEDGNVLILANYNSSIQNMNIKVELDPSKSGKSILSRYPLVQRQFIMAPFDNQHAVFYSNQSYEMFKITQILAYVVAGCSLFFFFIGIFADKLIGVQMMAVIQITYLGLMTLDGLNPGLNAIANLWFVNGFSYSYLTKNYIRDSFTPIKIKGVGMYSQFINNYNVTSLLILIPYILSCLCMIIYLIIKNGQKKQQIKKIAMKSCCQYVFTGLMFSAYIIVVSSAIQIKYRLNSLDSSNMLSLGGCTVLMGLIFIYFILKIRKQKYFGQFSQKFLPYQYQQGNLINQQKQENCRQKSIKLHYNFLIIERILVGNSIVVMIDQKYCLLSPIFIFITLILWSVIFKPYNKQKHNIRYICNMCISIVVLIIYLVYNITNQGRQMNPHQVWVYLPLVICILLLICVIYSAVFIIRSFVGRIKNIKGQEKTIQMTAQQQSKWFEQQNKIQTLFSKRVLEGNAEDAGQSLENKKKLAEIRKIIGKNKPFTNIQHILQPVRSTTDRNEQI